MRTLIDGYSLPDDDPELAIQLQINDYLSGPANERSFGSTAGRVLSATSTPEESYRWLMPLLRRAEWLLEHPEKARPHWASHLMCAVHILLNHNREQSERELLTLLGYSRVFRRTHEVGGFSEIAPRAVEAFRKTNDKQAWVEVMESTCFELEQFPTVHGGRFAAQLGMALMIDPASPASQSPCWSSVVAVDLQEMKKAAAGWRTLFALADTEFLYPREPREAIVAAAMKKIGPSSFAAQLDRWTAQFNDGREVYLSWRGVAVLKIALHGAALAPIPELQDSLLRLAKAKWRQADRASLALDLLVGAIVAQPPAFARTCLELLAAQPGAAENTALKVALSAPQNQESPLGVDGFPLDDRPSQAIFQHRLNAWLRAAGGAMRGDESLPDLRSLALRDENPDYQGLFSALLDRTEWLDKHRALIPNHSAMTRVLSRYLPDLQKLVSDVDRPALLRLMNADTVGALYCSPGEKILETVERYLGTHPFDVELVKVIEAWHAASHGTIADQTLRRHLGWLLWREDVKPVNLKCCWSSRIRQDLRDMAPAQSKRWRDLLAPMTFHICSAPPAKWKKQTAPLLKAVGAEDFADCLHRWFRPFSEETPLPLESTGGDVLRCLLWHAADIEDARVDEALSWFPKAHWKSKKSKGYTSKLIGPYVYALAQKPPNVAHAALEALVIQGDVQENTKNFEAYRALCEKLGRECREGIPAPAAPTAVSVAAKALRQAGCDLTEDAVFVKGEVESYRIDRQSREIRRVRDGAVVQIDTATQMGPEVEMIARMLRMMPGGDELRGLLPLVQILKMDSMFSRFLKVVSQSRVH